MKKEDSIFKELHLLMLPDVGRTLIYGNELVLLDNIGMDVEEELVSDFVSPSYPFKLTFTLVMFCLRGTMRVRLQLYCRRMMYWWCFQGRLENVWK